MALFIDKETYELTKGVILEYRLQLAAFLPENEREEVFKEIRTYFSNEIEKGLNTENSEIIVSVRENIKHLPAEEALKVLKELLKKEVEGGKKTEALKTTVNILNLVNSQK